MMFCSYERWDVRGQLVNLQTETYTKEIYHCPSDLNEAVSNNEMAMRVIVGATVSGPIYFINTPTSPLKPMTTESRDATKRQPDNCRDENNNNYWHIMVLRHEGN